jgi:hypothetical protein
MFDNRPGVVTSQRFDAEEVQQMGFNDSATTSIPTLFSHVGPLSQYLKVWCAPE